jgi:hypothetical protein
MGIGFVLLVWAVVLGCAAVPFSVGLAIWRWRTQRCSRPNTSLLRPIAAALLPFILLTYGGLAFIAYATWCETKRHVDAGIGDSWMVPVANNHFFCMIDVPEHGYLLKGGCSGSPAVSNIVDLAEVGDQIIGRSDLGGPFVLDTRSGEERFFPELEDAQKQIPTPATLQSANSFYINHRWGWLDLLALLIIGSFGAVIMFGWYRLFIRMPSTV